MSLCVCRAVPPYASSPCTVSLGTSGAAEVNLHKWVEAVNAFARFEMSDYIKHHEEYISRVNMECECESESESESDALVGLESGPTQTPSPGPLVWSHSGGYDHAQPGSRLVQYGMAVLPDLTTNPTAVYSSYMQGGKPRIPDARVLRCLSKNGISRVVVGHQPIGDMPVVLRADTKDTPVQILSCDTSYSTDVQWEGEGEGADKTGVSPPFAQQHSSPPPSSPPPPSAIRCTRGGSVTELLLSIPEEGGSTGRVHGILSNGQSYDMELPDPADMGALVGSQLSDGWLVRAEFPSTKACLVSHQDGFKVVNKIVHKDAVLLHPHTLSAQ